jgi:hypothetical protein
MRSDAVVIVGAGFRDPMQMHLAQDNDMVNTFTPDRSDQPFGKAILPRRGWCGKLVSDAHGAQSARDDAAIYPVAIADEVARSLVPGECLRDLTRNPFCRGICCDADPDEVHKAPGLIIMFALRTRANAASAHRCPDRRRQRFSPGEDGPSCLIGRRVKSREAAFNAFAASRRRSPKAPRPTGTPTAVGAQTGTAQAGQSGR